MADDMLKANIEIEKQLKQGKRVAIAETVIAPAQRYRVGSQYDPRSVRQLIEFLIGKAFNNFKSAQFEMGPTFALANLLRISLRGQEQHGLAPFYYDPHNGGACEIQDRLSRSLQKHQGEVWSNFADHMRQG